MSKFLESKLNFDFKESGWSVVKYDEHVAHEKNEAERKAKMGIWLQKLKQKLSWLYAAKISINSVDTANGILPDTDISFA